MRLTTAAKVTEIEADGAAWKPRGGNAPKEARSLPLPGGWIVGFVLFVIECIGDLA
jgi:hypothetical protein